MPLIEVDMETAQRLAAQAAARGDIHDEHD
jgi:hypothetical protein